MAFAPRWTEEADARFRELRTAAAAALRKRQKHKKAKASGAEGLFKQVEKCIRLLVDNPKHPGLNTHEYGSIPHPLETKGKVFEAYIQNRTPGACRLFWCYGPGKGEITIIAIAPHP